MRKVLHYFLTFVFFILIDLLWINLIIGPMYRAALGSAMREQAVVWSAVLAWLLIPLGIVAITVPSSSTARQSLIKGALYGMILYGVYDLTNYAILVSYTLQITVMDILWGTVLCSITSIVSWKLNKKINP